MKSFLKLKKIILFLCLQLFFLNLAFTQELTTVEGSHSVNKVAKPQTLIFVLDKAGLFEVFLSAIRQAGLEDKLSKEGPFTILAPRDAAFSHVGSIAREKLFSNKSNLKKFVEQHILIGKLDLADLNAVDSVPSLGGVLLSIEHKEPVEIERAAIIRSDIVADNGVVFMLNQAILAEH